MRRTTSVSGDIEAIRSTGKTGDETKEVGRLVTMRDGTSASTSASFCCSSRTGSSSSAWALPTGEMNENVRSLSIVGCRVKGRVVALSTTGESSISSSPSYSSEEEKGKGL